MPIRDLHQIAIFTERLDLRVVAITDHVVVLRDNDLDHSAIHIIPLTAFPCDNLLDAETFDLQDAPRDVFFLDDLTLCLLESCYEDFRTRLIRIIASDPEFTATTRVDQEIPPLRDCSIVNMNARRFRRDSTREVVLTLKQDQVALRQRRISRTAYEGVFPDLKTTLRVDARSAECTSMVEYEDDFSYERQSENGNGNIIVDFDIEGEGKIFYDTGHSLIRWAQYDCFYTRFEFNCGRWLYKKKNNTLYIFDAAERSSVPSDELEITQERCRPSLEISHTGLGILIFEGKIYKFKSPAYCKPLELLAAMATFDQLSTKMRDAINETGPYDFGTFTRICCDES